MRAAQGEEPWSRRGAADAATAPARGACFPSTAHGRGIRQVTLKIETASDGRAATLRLIGYVESEYLDELRAQVEKHRPRLVLDLDEVTLVDVTAVRFLIACEAEGIEMRHCAPYIREWMGRERPSS